MNSVCITGRLGEDPELKTTQNGVSVCSYRLAVRRPKVKDTTDWLNIVSWRQGAEYLAKFGRKGDLVAVTGALTARPWEDKDGHKRVAYEIVTETVELVGGRKDSKNDTGAAQDSQITAPAYTPNGMDVIYEDEDIPF